MRVWRLVHFPLVTGSGMPKSTLPKAIALLVVPFLPDILMNIMVISSLATYRIQSLNPGTSQAPAKKDIKNKSASQLTVCVRMWTWTKSVRQDSDRIRNQNIHWRPRSRFLQRFFESYLYLSFYLCLV